MQQSSISCRSIYHLQSYSLNYLFELFYIIKIKQNKKMMLQQITNWSIDTPATEEQYLFQNQLIRENKWCSKYTDQVIQEYKKFLYLCQISNVACVPSKAIDEVWHMHILRTVNYSTMCKELFGKFLHHAPTNGKQAQLLLQEQFKTTLEVYQKTFGQTAPASVWAEKGNGVCCSEI